MAHPRRSEDDADDRGARERTCVATRIVRPVEKLIRFVASPDGVLTPDLKRRLPGRGVHVSATRAAFDLALKKKAFARALKDPVELPPDLGARIESLLERAALEMLSFANKAGLVAPGTAKALRAIEFGRVRAILHAKEASRDSMRDFAKAGRAVEGAPEPEIIRIFDSAQLDLALGRANVIHAALVAGPACDGFLEKVAALDFWRHGGLPAAASDAPSGRASDIGISPDEPVARSPDDIRDCDEDEPVRPAGSETE